MSSTSKKRKLVVWGVALGVVVGCVLSAWFWVDHRQDQALRVHEKFMGALRDDDLESAYRLMSCDYRERHSLSRFAEDSFYFKVDYETDWIAGGGLLNTVWVFRRNSEGWVVGREHVYVKEEDGWRFTGQGTIYSH